MSTFFYKLWLAKNKVLFEAKVIFYYWPQYLYFRAKN